MSNPRKHAQGKKNFFRRIFSSKPPSDSSSPPTSKPPSLASFTGRVKGHKSGNNESVQAATSTMNVSGAMAMAANDSSRRFDILNQPHLETPSGVEPSTASKDNTESFQGVMAGAHHFEISHSNINEVHGNQTNRYHNAHNPTNVIHGGQTNVTVVKNKFINQPLKYDFVGHFQSFDVGGAVLLLLDKKRVAGAEADSADRDPPPRCHPETRRELREILVSWLLGPDRPWTFIWLSGPAGAGKTAVAQTFAEYCLEKGRLGASFFFSRLQKRESPNGIIATIAYQLADHDARYNHIITEILSRNPSILDKALRIQFQRLIIEPFAILSSQYTAENSVGEPLVIIVDGLDECNDERAQCELIKLIGEHADQLKASPLPVLWLVCSRPEWHLKRTLGQTLPPIGHRREEITCNAADDLKDVYYILRDGLQQIRDSTSWDFSPPTAHKQWPSETKLQRLAQSVGGLPVLAATVLRFIGDGNSSPDSLLELCLLCLESVRNHNPDMNPLDALDIFYLQIISSIPRSVSAVTQRILAFTILSPKYHFSKRNTKKETEPEQYGSPVDISAFFGIDQDTFYGALRKLHSVVAVPLPQSAHNNYLRFFHKSFEDFLLDPARSGRDILDIEQATYDIAITALSWKNHFNQEKCELEDCDLGDDDFSLANLKWVQGNSIEEALYSIYTFIRLNYLDLCMSVPAGKRAEILHALVKFNFCHFRRASEAENEDLHRFLQWLVNNMAEHPHADGLLRFQPASERDQALFKRVPREFTFRDKLPNEYENWKYKHLSFVSDHYDSEINPQSAEMPIWVGQGERSVMVLIEKPEGSY